MEPTCSSETSDDFQRTTLRYMWRTDQQLNHWTNVFKPRNYGFSLKILGQLQFSVRFVHNKAYFTCRGNELFHVHHKLPPNLFSEIWNESPLLTVRAHSDFQSCWLIARSTSHTSKEVNWLSIYPVHRFTDIVVIRYSATLCCWNAIFFSIHRPNFVHRWNAVYNPAAS
jgi:hypothetical protein